MTIVNVRHTSCLKRYKGDHMPATPRIKGAATRIAFKILGMPGNMRSKRTKEREVLDKRLTEEETVRVR